MVRRERRGKGRMMVSRRRRRRKSWMEVEEKEETNEVEGGRMVMERKEWEGDEEDEEKWEKDGEDEERKLEPLHRMTSIHKS